MSSKKFQLPMRYRDQTEIVWYDYVKLALEYKPVDLGAGYPDFAAPEHLTKALSAVSSSDDVLIHQYTRGVGHPRLVNVLAKLYSQLIGVEIDPLNNILITCGAYGALNASIFGHVDVGDEVIIIEPSFDSYVPVIIAAGGVPIFVPLKLKETTDSPTSKDFVFDVEELRGAFNSKTKAIIINTPQNPTGKVFSTEELEEIASLCKKWDAICISDEVYEWLVYKPNKHVRIASLPGMWERTITIGSAGKTFSITGWKIGWAYGPESLIQNLKVIHQNSVFTCNTPSQEAVAIGFETELARLNSKDCYFNQLLRDMEVNKSYISKFLKSAGFKPIIPDGGYFVVVDWSPLESRVDLSEEKDKQRDYRFTKWLIKNVGVLGIPTSAFYSRNNKHLGENFVRFCFIKDHSKLSRADEIFQKWNNAN